tara:strand:+ start:237 stop:812 length:576 start_codon:yes stop_codon:yes gene_type:complete
MLNYEQTDEELISQFQDGNVKAFNELVNRYKDRLLNYVYHFFNDIDLAEDIVQDTFLKLYTHKNSYKQVAKFSTWIYTIAGNLSKTELRKQKRRKTFSISDLSYDNNEFVISSNESTPEEKIVTKDDIDNLKSGMDKLSVDFKTVIILRDIQELSYDIISSIIEMPLGTVKSRINRARLKLQHILMEKGEK